MVAERMRGQRVYIRRDDRDGFDGVVTDTDQHWIYVEVADDRPDGFKGIWYNTENGTEIGILK